MLIRILEIPESSGNYCFGTGNLQNWKEVDWFRDDLSSGNKTPMMGTPEGREQIKNFIKKKNYFHADKSYLVLHQDYTFTINYKAA